MGGRFGKAKSGGTGLSLLEEERKRPTVLGKKAEVERSVVVKGLSEHAVANPSDVLGLIHRAQERRKVGETKMNKHSSRSHCVFTLTVATKRAITNDDGTDAGTMEACGKLHLVDLAGSECAKTAGKESDGAARMAECKNIIVRKHFRNVACYDFALWRDQHCFDHRWDIASS
mgnify:CR=1 FL=1